MTEDLHDQTALVTGGGQGIGQVICERLARHGADVAIADLPEADIAETKSLVEEVGRAGLEVPLDLREEDAVIQAADTALDHFDSIEILVNNAGIAGPTAPCEDVTIEQWDRTMDVNLRGMFLMTRELLPAMKQTGYGRIVNIASITGKRPLYQRTPYAASKMGVIGFTRTLAAEVAEHDINANAICPGPVEGPRIRRVFEAQAEARDVASAEVREEFEAEIPRNELIQPEDVAESVAFLCSSDATRITGEDLNVAGGLVMY